MPWNASPRRPPGGARRVQRLDIGVPSHCPLLDHVADAMADHLAKIPQRPLAVPYVGDATGRLLHDSGAVLDDLARGIATTVRWRDAIALLGELGTTVFIQTPPGHVLARIAQAAHPRARVITLAETGIADAALLAAAPQRPRATQRRDREAGDGRRDQGPTGAEKNGSRAYLATAPVIAPRWRSP